MGDYTGLRCKIKVKKEFIEEIENVVEYRCWDVVDSPELMQYCMVGRSSQIPVGIGPMPDEWLEFLNVSNEWVFEKFEKSTGLWMFQCSLKNSCNTIESFFELVLPTIAMEVLHLETHFEYDEYSKLYKLINNKIVVSSEAYKKYR